VPRDGLASQGFYLKNSQLVGKQPPVANLNISSKTGGGIPMGPGGPHAKSPRYGQ